MQEQLFQVPMPVELGVMADQWRDPIAIDVTPQMGGAAPETGGKVGTEASGFSFTYQYHSKLTPALKFQPS